MPDIKQSEVVHPAALQTEDHGRALMLLLLQFGFSLVYDLLTDGTKVVRLQKTAAIPDAPPAVTHLEI